MKTIKRYMKRFGNWYFTKYMEFYAPMINNGVNPFMI